MDISLYMDILGEMAWRVIHFFVLLVWHMLWPLVIGFMLSAWVRTRIPTSLVTRELGKNSVSSIGETSLLGIVSSVCNYAVVGMAKTLYDKGATWPNIMIYMLASTNLGITMLLTVYGFMGSQMLGMLAVASLISMVIVWALSVLFFPEDTRPTRDAQGVASRGMWVQTAIHFYDDIAMTRNDILIGITVAALASGVIPTTWWQALFLHESDTTLIVWLWNAALGLTLAVLTFGCSIGNVALAAVLWWNGASPGGVMAFMLGSLLTVPMLHVYYRNFGGRLAWKLAWVQAVGIICAAITVDALIWQNGISLSRVHAAAGSNEAPLYLLLGNIVFGGIGLGFYIMGKKHSSMSGMTGMGGMSEMHDMKDMHNMHGMAHENAQPMPDEHMHHSAMTVAQEPNAASHANVMLKESTTKAEEHVDSPHDHMKM